MSGFFAIIIISLIMFALYKWLEYVEQYKLKQYLFFTSGVILLLVGFGLVWFFKSIGWLGSVGIDYVGGGW